MDVLEIGDSKGLLSPRESYAGSSPATSSRSSLILDLEDALVQDGRRSRGFLPLRSEQEP